MPAVALLIAAGFVLALFALGDGGFAGRLEGDLLDLRFRLRPPRAPEQRITVVAIDDASIGRLGRWPWSRTLLAAGLDRLHQAGAAVIGLDILLSEPEGAEADAALARAIPADAPVLLAFAASRLAAAPPGWMTRFAYPHIGGVPDLLPGAPGLTPPLPGFGQLAAGLGDVTLTPGPDGRFRADLSVIRIDGLTYPSFALEAARMMHGVPPSQVIVQPGGDIQLGGVQLPTDGDTRLLVDMDPVSRFDVVPFADVIDGTLAPSRLAGRMVLIGATATGLGDRLATPFDPASPGILRHAAAISGLLDGRVIRRDGTTHLIDALAILAGCLGVGVAGRRRALPGLGAGLAVLAALAALDVATFDLLSWWLSALLPLAAAFATTLAVLLIHQRRRSAEVGKFRRAAERDALTGLLNREGLRAWRETEAGAWHLLGAADLDGFKAVNDTLGHAAGDLLLREVAARLRAALRPGDVAIRLGGDEFLVVLRKDKEDGALATARAAFTAVSQPYQLDGHPAAVGMSLGLAAWPDDARDWTTALALADAALYAAKRAGKRCIFRADPTGEPHRI